MTDRMLSDAAIAVYVRLETAAMALRDALEQVHGSGRAVFDAPLTEVEPHIVEASLAVQEAMIVLNRSTLGEALALVRMLGRTG